MLTQFRQEEQGSHLVEFAVTITVFLMVVFGILDGSRAMYVDHWVANAAREATRYASVRGATWTAACGSVTASACAATQANVTTLVNSLATAGIDPAKITVTTAWPGTTASGADCSPSNTNNAVGCVVQVQVSYAFAFKLPFLPKTGLTLASTSAVSVLE